MSGIPDLPIHIDAGCAPDAPLHSWHSGYWINAATLRWLYRYKPFARPVQSPPPGYRVSCAPWLGESAIRGTVCRRGIPNRPCIVAVAAIELERYAPDPRFRHDCGWKETGSKKNYFECGHPHPPPAGQHDSDAECAMTTRWRKPAEQPHRNPTPSGNRTASGQTRRITVFQ